MISTSHKTLKNIAAIIWLTGGVILFYKGYLLLKEANIISPNIEIISAVMATAFITGLIKNKYIMSKFNIKNLARIRNLENPKMYQFFEPTFILLLILMIIAGITFSKMASENYIALLIIGGFDLALSTALLKSSVLFFKETSE